MIINIIIKNDNDEIILKHNILNIRNSYEAVYKLVEFFNEKFNYKFRLFEV